MADHVPGGGGHLAAVGPVSADTGFPVWYEDENGLRTSLCLDGDDPLCGFLPGDIPDPAQPVSFPDNFPEEAFYMLAGAGMDTAGGRAVNVLALEAAFANAVQDGDQMVFGRVRHRIDGLQPNASYTITHPYGVDTEVADATGEIRFTEDIGVTPGAFAEALNSRIGPFLRWDTGAPAGYLGDPAVEHTITGSPFGTNFLRIEGPSVGAPGDPNLCDPAAAEPTSCIETDLFTLQGKLATNAGVSVPRVTFSTTPAGDGLLDVFATSSPNQSIEVSGSGFDPTRLDGDDQGNYFARVAFTGAAPAQVQVSNVGDDPVANKNATPADFVDAGAAYDTDTDTLTIQATSSDQAGAPTLTAVGYGDLVGGELTVTTTAPPDSVQVTSASGGSDTARVVVDGGENPAIPVQAFAGVDQVVSVGAPVTLDGSGSAGPVQTYSWVQVSGASVALAGADTATPTFTAPAAAATLRSELTVDGPGAPRPTRSRSRSSRAPRRPSPTPGPISSTSPRRRR